MKVVELNPDTDERWVDFLARTPGASIFHHPAWLSVLAATYGYLPICLAAIEDDSVVGVLPLMEVRSWITGKRAVCLPFSDRCGPAARSPSALAALLQASEELRADRGWRYVELRESVQLPAGSDVAHYKVHQTALGDDPEALFRRFKKTQTQQAITAARKCGVHVERRTDPLALATLIHLNAVTRRRHGVPPQPDSFFLNIARKVLGVGLGFIGTATVNGHVASAALFLHWKDVIVYKYSASNEIGRSVKASHAIIWDAMQWGCQHGFRVLDLGRTDLTNNGLLQFKRGWGSDESDLVYLRYGVAKTLDDASESSGMVERLKPFTSRIPLPILKLIGRGVYAHFG